MRRILNSPSWKISPILQELKLKVGSDKMLPKEKVS